MSEPLRHINGNKIPNITIFFTFMMYFDQGDNLEGDMTISTCSYVGYVDHPYEEPCLDPSSSRLLATKTKRFIGYPKKRVH